MIKVLLVEDEYLERIALKNIIESHSDNYKIIGEADNGEKAVLMALKLKPDIIIMDIVMPIMTGIDAAEIIKEKIDTKIIFLTAYADFEYARDGIRLGVLDYLLKPVRKEKLLVSLENAITKTKPAKVKENHNFSAMIKKANITEIHDHLNDKLLSLNNDEIIEYRKQLTEELKVITDEINDRDVKNRWNNSIKEIQKISSFKVYIYSVLWLIVQMGTYFYKERKSVEGGGLDLSIQYIELNLREDLKLDNIAKEAGFSSTYYSKILKKQYKQNFSDYIKDRRINYSKILLKNTSLNINEIAEDCGFNESNYYSKVFKDKTGISPTNYRDGKL